MKLKTDNITSFQSIKESNASFKLSAANVAGLDVHVNWAEAVSVLVAVTMMMFIVRNVKAQTLSRENLPSPLSDQRN